MNYFILKNSKKLIILGLIYTSNIFSTAPVSRSSLSDYINVVRSLPTKRNLSLPVSSHTWLASFNAFEKEQERFFATMTDQLGNTDTWLDSSPKIPHFLKNITFKPYVQKLTVPQKAEIALWGDLHGCIHMLLESLEKLRNTKYIDDQFKIIKDNFYLIFLGDYTDSNIYGTEIWYILMRLKNANPDHVFMVRGNHEDAGINNYYGFKNELTDKFKLTPSQINNVYKLYDLLPVALYLSVKDISGINNVIVCCHGGLEVGFDPHELLNASQTRKYTWLNNLNRSTNINRLRDHSRTEIFNTIPGYERTDFTPHDTYSIGFLWHDFYVTPSTTMPLGMNPEWKSFYGTDNENKHTIGFNKGRGWIYGRSITEDILRQQSDKKYSIHGIFRGHQISDDPTAGPMCTHMKQHHGIAPLYDGCVHTFFSAPHMDRLASEFPYRTFGLLKTDTTLNNWVLEHWITDNNTGKHTIKKTLSPITSQRSVTVEPTKIAPK